MLCLTDKHCVPCEGGVPALKGATLNEYEAQLPDWRVVDEHHLERGYRFPDFKQALDFVNRIGAIAEEEGHHPDIGLSWGKVEVKMYTHAVNGLTENDFVLAAKIEQARTEGTIHRIRK